MDEMEVVMRRLGEEQSKLLDQYERLSFEVQLNQAMLGRSLSEPGGRRSRYQAPAPPRQGRRRSFHKFINKLLKPILARKGSSRKQQTPDPKDPMTWNSFSRSLRV